MEKVNIGNSDLCVSRIGLGCMSLQSEQVMGLRDTLDSVSRTPQERETQSLHAVSECIDVLGINFFDTADVYGDSELILAKALALRPRSSYVLATKFGASGKGAAGNLVSGFCEQSLKRLQTPFIDLYYLHRVDKATPIEETVGAMSQLVKHGHVRYLGLSEASGATLRRAHAVHPISAMQSEYSAWFREIETNGVLDTCRELGVSLVAFSPLGRGFLAGSAKPGNIAPNDFRATGSERYTGENALHNAKIAEEIAEIAKRKECTSAQLALGWLMAQGQNIIPIPGTSRIERLRENAAATKLELSKKDVEEINDVVQRIGVAGNRYVPELLARVNL